MALQEKWYFGCLWLRSRISAHNKLSEAEQLLGLFQFNLLFALYQSSNSGRGPLFVLEIRGQTDQLNKK